MPHKLLFNCYEATVFEGLFGGMAGIYVFPCQEVTFQRITLRTRLAALNAGYSPAVSLPSIVKTEDGDLTNYWQIESETAKAVIEVYGCTSKTFWSIDVDKSVE